VEQAPLQLELVEAGPDQAPVLLRLLHLYAYDFSELTGSDLDELGLFAGGTPLATCWEHPWRHAYVIRATTSGESHVAGFTILDERSRLTGDPEGPPTKSGLSLVDLSGGYASVIAVLAGLWRSRRDGVGCDCDVSLFETALHELMYVGTWSASRGYTPPRRPNSAHPSIVPFQNFETADGWIVVACPKEKFWVALCGALGRPELATDERFADFAARDRNRDELLPILDGLFAERSSAEWLDVLGEAGVPRSPVNDVAAAFDADGLGAVINSSRGILYAYGEPAAPAWKDAVRGAARTLRDQLRRAAQSALR